MMKKLKIQCIVDEITMQEALTVAVKMWLEARAEGKTVEVKKTQRAARATKAQKEEALELLKGGMDGEEVREKLGVSANLIKILKKELES
ncbi:MAG: hypothetical protein R8K20_06315 [Gallionellaceae bacterium]